MSKTKIALAFKSIHQLWKFAQRVNAINIEISTAEKILICECSEEELKLLPQFGGMVIDENKSNLNEKGTD